MMIWIRTFLLTNHLGKTEAITFKIVGLKFVIKFRIAEILRTKLTLKVYLHSLKFRVPEEARSRSSDAQPRIQDSEK